VTAPVATAAEFRHQAGLQVLTWPVFDGLGADVLITTRQGGVSAGEYATLNLSFSVGDDPAAVLENRRRAAAAVGAEPTDVVYARQVHGGRAQVVTAADRGRGAQALSDAIENADALVTTDPGTTLAIQVADCVPIVLLDPVARVLACVHAGWRGTVARIGAAALDTMTDLGARPADVRAGIGPAIAPDRYQVGDEVAGEVRRGLGSAVAGEVLRPDGPGKWLLDLWAANRRVLTDAGVPAGHVLMAGVPTGPEPGMFFSHRAAQPAGRFALVARLRPDAGQPDPGGDR
jgi:YfiH family protein